jgi:hypothetical protein
LNIFFIRITKFNKKIVQSEFEASVQKSAGVKRLLENIKYPKPAPKITLEHSHTLNVMKINMIRKLRRV